MPEPTRTPIDPPFWLSATAYWQPEHVVTSAWWEHAPFAFWLMDALRPRSVMELGTHFGFSMFAFAEAARRLGLPTRLYALDSWTGDDQAGYYGDEVFASVAATAARDYPGAIELVRGYFADSRERFQPSSIDLLHIDGRHGYEDAKDDYLRYVDLVRDGGVVLFHDIAERSEGFGVWRLWEEVSVGRPAFAFEHGHGLGVLAVGEAAPALRPLFDCDALIAGQIRSDFARLGRRVTRQAELEAMPAEVDSLHVVVESLGAEIERLQGAVSERTAAVDEMRSSTSWRVTAPLRAAGGLLRRR